MSTIKQRTDKAIDRAEQRDLARTRLLEYLKPGDTVYSIIRTVARSGMSRTIDLYCLSIEDGKPTMHYLTGMVANLIGYMRSDKGLHVSGCGMDMCSHTVYTIGALLWPQGTPEPHGIRNGEPDSTGGYALRSERL